MQRQVALIRKPLNDLTPGSACERKPKLGRLPGVRGGSQFLCSDLHLGNSFGCLSSTFLSIADGQNEVPSHDQKKEPVRDASKNRAS